MNGADGRSRTATAYATTPSRWRVYQFHHVGLNLLFKLFILEQRVDQTDQFVLQVLLEDHFPVEELAFQYQSSRCLFHLKSVLFPSGFLFERLWLTDMTGKNCWRKIQRPEHLLHGSKKMLNLMIQIRLMKHRYQKRLRHLRLYHAGSGSTRSGKVPLKYVLLVKSTALLTPLCPGQPFAA